MLRLTFAYVGLFTVATDEGTGQRFRVLLATGTTKSRYCLEPWHPEGKAVFYRRRFVDADSRLFAAVDAAEKARPRTTTLTEEQRKRIEADFV